MTAHRHALLALATLLALPLGGWGQAADVTLCPGWVATVDESSQQIVLSWRPSPDSTVMGYHICTGSPCVDYDTVFGRLDTTYICSDHSPLERHYYGLHVFDSTLQASAETPFFGNIVLEATVPECETDVQVSWSPYIGMPEGSPLYTLWVRLEPSDDDYDCYYTTSDSSALHHSFEIPEEVTRAWLKVQAEGLGGYRSQSNVVMVERRTVDRASFVEISHIEYDSINTQVLLSCHLDTAFRADHYTLYRSIDGSPWREVGSFSTHNPTYTFADRDINPYDSLHCYQLGVLDACGMNEQYSSTTCLVVPTPPEPATAFPNIIVAGDPDNGCFRPIVLGLMGDLYQLSIYNRHGLLVFRTEDQNEGWTPTADTPQGVYAYHLRCRLNTGYIQNYAGTFALIK
ncbi:MAG: gliding motility-associated C-terminal domain-containing protein [Bacteroidales bacterium]|nr:gliding motility-associated C-terminal domain-containing protein [Bacteroidales bacterium]